MDEIEEIQGSAETIERLSRQLEQHKILADLKECKTIDDLKKLTIKYQLLCDNHNKQVAL